MIRDACKHLLRRTRIGRGDRPAAPRHLGVHGESGQRQDRALLQGGDRGLRRAVAEVGQQLRISLVLRAGPRGFVKVRQNLLQLLRGILGAVEAAAQTILVAVGLAQRPQRRLGAAGQREHGVALEHVAGVAPPRGPALLPQQAGNVQLEILVGEPLVLLGLEGQLDEGGGIGPREFAQAVGIVEHQRREVVRGPGRDLAEGRRTVLAALILEADDDHAVRGVDALDDARGDEIVVDGIGSRA